jgi:spermidine synthase
MKEKNLWIRDHWDEKRGSSITVMASGMLAKRKTRFQTIEIYDTEGCGRVMMIDGIIMLTESDEFAYHEMITHPAMHVHPDPKQVLVIGGGDGGAVREILKHNVDEVHLCEIDADVISISKEFFPSIACGLCDPRVKIFTDDGAEFINNKAGYYDVILVDSTDPVGPAEVLFREPFYRAMNNALTENGIASTQSEGIYYDLDTIIQLFSFTRKIFPVVEYYYTMVPTYPSGTIGFSFCSKKLHPLRDRADKGIKGLKYYNDSIHNSAFVLPEFARMALKT